jgi:hypothetical protein
MAGRYFEGRGLKMGQIGVADDWCGLRQQGRGVKRLKRSRMTGRLALGGVVPARIIGGEP